MCVLSAFTVETSSVGFAPCWWAATSRGHAEALAEKLSHDHSEDPRYPNAFHVVDSKSHSSGKWFRGQRFDPSYSI